MHSNWGRELKTLIEGILFTGTHGSQILSMIFLVGSMCMSQASATNIETQRPNIIYLMLDDAGYGDFGSFRSSYVKTTHFDRLCTEGMTF